MGKMVTIRKPFEIEIEDFAEAPLQSNQVRIKTQYSGISAGTELTVYRGNNPFSKKKWNAELHIFEPSAEPSMRYPVSGGVGYEEVGVVAELGSAVQEIHIGDVVYGAWGHRSSHTVTEDYAKVHRLPKELDPICGIFAQMGAIGLNAILDADIHIGETVAIFGQGVPGQIVAQLAKQNGATVIAVDLDDWRLAQSCRFGADIALNSRNCDVAREIKQMTEGRGADICIEISGVSAALHEAIRAVAYSGRVVCSGFMPGSADGLFLGEEFHHNRINIVGSQINGLAPHLTYRWDRIRMEQTIMKLQQTGQIDLKSLITHRVQLDQVAQAFDRLHRGAEPSLQVVMEF